MEEGVVGGAVVVEVVKVGAVCVAIRVTVGVTARAVTGADAVTDTGVVFEVVKVGADWGVGDVCVTVGVTAGLVTGSDVVPDS